jgi:four helix bundle protein
MTEYNQSDTHNFLIKEMEKKYEVNLDERLINFSVDIIKMLQTLPYKKELDVFRYQLSKSATSIGANFQEAQSTTYKEFISKLRIALREANETKYWLRIISELNLVNKDNLIKLIDEVEQTAKILGAIVSRADKKHNKK